MGVSSKILPTGAAGRDPARPLSRQCDGNRGRRRRRSWHLLGAARGIAHRSAAPPSLRRPTPRNRARRGLGRCRRSCRHRSGPGRPGAGCTRSRHPRCASASVKRSRMPAAAAGSRLETRLVGDDDLRPLRERAGRSRHAAAGRRRASPLAPGHGRAIRLARGIQAPAAGPRDRKRRARPRHAGTWPRRPASTLSRADSRATRPKRWNTTATRRSPRIDREAIPSIRTSPASGGTRASEAAKQRGLAGTAGPEDRHELALAHGDIDPVKHPHFAKALDQSRGGQTRWHGAHGLDQGAAQPGRQRVDACHRDEDHGEDRRQPREVEQIEAVLDLLADPAGADHPRGPSRRAR